MKNKQWKDIFEASKHLDTSAVKYFIEEVGIPANSTESYEHRTAAHIAAKNNDLKTVSYLLKVDSSLVNTSDVYFNTIATESIMHGALDVIKYLVDDGLLDISQPNEQRYGNTAIHEAAGAQTERLDILKYFLEEKHGDINIRNECGEPPLFLAADRGHTRIMKYLIARGANATMVDAHNDNVLYILARRGDLDLAQFLLDEKKVRLNVNWRNNLNMTVVHMAAKFNHLHILRYFIAQKNGDLTMKDNSGRFALHLAARANNFDVVKYLVNQGSNANMKDIHGLTPTQLATQANVIKYLEKVTGGRRKYRSVFVESPTILHYTFSSGKPLHRQAMRQHNIIALSESADRFLARGSDKFHNAFAFIHFCLRYFTRYNHFSFGQSILMRNLESKIDSLAIDAVNDTFNFYSDSN